MSKSDVPESLNAGFCTHGTTAFGAVPVPCGYCEELRNETTLNNRDLPAKYLFTQELELDLLEKGGPKTVEQLKKNAALFEATVSVQSRWNMLDEGKKRGWRKLAAKTFGNEPPTSFTIINGGKRILFIKPPEEKAAASSVGPSDDKEEVAASSVGPSGNKGKKKAREVDTDSDDEEDTPLKKGKKA